MGINMCQGICTSQLDDYCGMFMDGEECPACKAVWEAAHKENHKMKLAKAKAWFENVTEMDSSLIGFMGLTESRLVQMYEYEVEGKVSE